MPLFDFFLRLNSHSKGLVDQSFVKTPFIATLGLLADQIRVQNDKRSRGPFRSGSAKSAAPKRPPSPPPKSLSPPPKKHKSCGFLGLKCAAEKVVGSVKTFGKSFVDTVGSAAKSTWDLTGRALYDPKGAGRAWKNMGKGLLWSVGHPIQAGKALLDWKDLSKGDIAKWLGYVGGNVAMWQAGGALGDVARGASAARVAAEGAEVGRSASRLSRMGARMGSAAKAYPRAFTRRMRSLPSRSIRASQRLGRKVAGLIRRRSPRMVGESALLGKELGHTVSPSGRHYELQAVDKAKSAPRIKGKGSFFSKLRSSSKMPNNTRAAASGFTKLRRSKHAATASDQLAHDVPAVQASTRAAPQAEFRVAQEQANELANIAVDSNPTMMDLQAVLADEYPTALGAAYDYPPSVPSVERTSSLAKPVLREKPVMERLVEDPETQRLREWQEIQDRNAFEIARPHLSYEYGPNYPRVRENRGLPPWHDVFKSQ